MSDEFGPTFVTVTDENGQELTLEFVTSIELNGQEYRAFFPTESEEEGKQDPDNGLIILKVIQEAGEELLSTCDSEEELSTAYDALMELLFDEEEDTP